MNDSVQTSLFTRAVELKQNQLRQSRPFYEAAPEFVKHTVVHDDFDERYRVLRQSSIDERVEFSNKYIAQANEAFGEQSYNDALDHYTDALAVFCYFARGPEASTNTLTYKDYLDDPQADEEGRQVVKTVMLNAAACLMNINLNAHAKDVAWSCGHALRADATCAKAYYRRGKAFMAIDAHDDAMKDLQRAVELAPEDAQCARTLKICTQARSIRESEAREIFGKMFNAKTPIYDNDDERTPLTRSKGSASSFDSEVASEVDRVLLDADLMYKARAMGFDVSDDRFREELAARVREEILQDKLKHAEELGLDLNDEKVKRAMEFFERQKQRDGGQSLERGRLAGWRAVCSAWTSYVSPALLVLIFSRVVYIIVKLITTPLP